MQGYNSKALSDGIFGASASVGILNSAGAIDLSRFGITERNVDFDKEVLI